MQQLNAAEIDILSPSCFLHQWPAHPHLSIASILSGLVVMISVSKGHPYPTVFLSYQLCVSSRNLQLNSRLMPAAYCDWLLFV